MDGLAMQVIVAWDHARREGLAMDKGMAWAKDPHGAHSTGQAVASCCRPYGSLYCVRPGIRSNL